MNVFGIIQAKFSFSTRWLIVLFAIAFNIQSGSSSKFKFKCSNLTQIHRLHRYINQTCNIQINLIKESR